MGTTAALGSGTVPLSVFKWDVSLGNWGRQSDFISQKLSITHLNPDSFPQPQKSLPLTTEPAEGRENNYFEWMRMILKIYICLFKEVQRPTPEDSFTLSQLYKHVTMTPWPVIFTLREAAYWTRHCGTLLALWIHVFKKSPTNWEAMLAIYISVKELVFSI